MSCLSAEVEQNLFEAANAIRDRAHAPYSNFKVSACLLTPDGKTFTGVNVENAAYPQGQCAEANALAAMVLSGHKAVSAILVLGGEAGSDILCTPCGGCRQKIREFGNEDTIILVARPDGIVMRTTLGELLPHSFGPDNLASIKDHAAGEAG
jgi:cytidine deaminase